MIVSALRVRAEPSPSSYGTELLSKTSFYIACAEVITLDNRRAGSAMSIQELKHIGGSRSKNFSTKRIASMETVGEGAHGPIVVESWSARNPPAKNISHHEVGGHGSW